MTSNVSSSAPWRSYDESPALTPSFYERWAWKLPHLRNWGVKCFEIMPVANVERSIDLGESTQLHRAEREPDAANRVASGNLGTLSGFGLAWG